MSQSKEPSEQEILSTISQIIKEELSGETTLSSENIAEELDSMQQLSLVVAIEDHFEICLDPEDEQRVETLQDLTVLIKEKLSQKV